jgi:hypothetical protein
MAEWTKEERIEAAGKLYAIAWGTLDDDYPGLRPLRLESMLRPWSENPNQHVHILEAIRLQCEVTALREALDNLRSIDVCACLDNEDYCPHAVADRLLTKIPK